MGIAVGGGSIATLMPGLALAAGSNTSAVIVMYHRFGEKKFPSTNITLQQFENHIKILTLGPYTVLPLPEIIKKIKNGEALPTRTVGIAIDDAYRSTFTEAWPRLKKAKLPFTVFVSTNHVDRKLSNMMSWGQIRTLVKNGVTIGHHTASHLHMADHAKDKNKQDIAASSERFQKEIGFVPKIFAYPYGEASRTEINIVRDAGFKAAFGQHSGVFDQYSSFFYLPRFAMNETYGSPSRFRTAINALSLPLAELTPENPLILSDNPPAIGFTITKPIKRLKSLACYTSHAGRANVIQLGANRIEVRINKPFPTGRSRLNCTLPTDTGRWYWFGWQYYVPKKPR
jgi:peptidoglycan/xylan/chitin deacetylase (PgdA/CDA1 family)